MAEINFPFPFPPYDVQEDFMKNLYAVLDEQKVGIFESPTGTGKSLSIICGAFKWMKDFQEQRLKELQDRLNEKINAEGDDWFNDFLHKQEKSHSLLDAKEEYAFLTENEERLKKIRAKIKNKKSSNVQLVSSNAKRKHSDIEDDENLEDDFIINQERDSEELENEQKDKKHVLKIYFASRTHSQLAQFIGEIKRSPYKDNITVTALGSRSNFCINGTVSKLKNVSLINESCTELQRQKSKGKKCCPYMKNFEDMQDDILSAVKDIEEIVTQGQKLHSCPYYATRKVIPDVEVVVLPYNILLHKPTRDTYGITLKNNIVIIDEAHNLIESINSMYSSEINGACLEQTFWQVDAYRKCYSSRLSQNNLKYIKLVCFVLKAFINGLKLSNVENQKLSSEMVTYNDFVTLMGVGHINFFELVKYCDDTLIAHKIHGFTAAKVAKGITPLDDQTRDTALPQKSATASFLSHIKETQNIVKDKVKEIKEVIEPTKNSNMQYKPSAIFSFIEFLKTLTFPTEDGRIILNRSISMKDSYLKFLHLNPSSHFKDVVSEPRSFILAGGTMQPISEFEDLFINSGVPRDRISYFTCGHVIPPENLLAIGLANGPCGSSLDFTFNKRQLPQTVKELGSVLLNVCNAVSGGVVCFFPSYDYEQFIFNELKKSKLLETIGKKKKLFREPKFSSDVDRVLTDYAKCISLSSAGKNSFNGALLFSIVGGKMSEGINFSDNLGRCVVMVGLPFPNKYSVELKEKMAYLNKTCKPCNGKSAGDIYYNNLCMKAVNQSIGRAIRHKNDYACILLLDYRYNHASVKNSLPQWILKSFSFHEKFGSAVFSMRKFFLEKKQS